MAKNNNNLLVAVSAFATGVIAGLLIAPRTGEETRAYLNEQARLQSGKVAEKAKELNEQARVQSEKIAEQARLQGNRVVEKAKEVAQESAKTAQETWKSAQSAVKKNIEAIDQEVHWDKTIGENLTKAVDEVAGGN